MMEGGRKRGRREGRWVGGRDGRTDGGMGRLWVGYRDR